MYLLDTNVLSELRKKDAAPAVVEWIAARDATELFVSVMTIFEIELGVRRIERRDGVQGARLRAWLDGAVLDAFRGRILPLDIAVARRTAELHVPDPRAERDSWIAATALTHDLTLVTRNVRDFDGVGGLAIIDPWRASGR